MVLATSRRGIRILLRCRPAGVGRPLRLAGFVDGPVADQVADVGHHPVLAGLDEPVLVELGDVVFDDVHLLGDHLQQGAQRIALLGVAQAVDGRQQVVEAVPPL